MAHIIFCCYQKFDFQIIFNGKFNKRYKIFSAMRRYKTTYKGKVFSSYVICLIIFVSMIRKTDRERGILYVHAYNNSLRPEKAAIRSNCYGKLQH